MLYHKRLLWILWILLAVSLAHSSNEDSSSYCTSLEREFKFVPVSYTAAENFTSEFIETLNKCNPPTEDQQYYHNMLLSTLNQRSSDDKIEVIISASRMIVNSIPSLSQYLPQDNTQDIKAFINDIKENDLFIKTNNLENIILSDNNMVTRHTRILDVDFRVVSLYSNVKADFLICQNSEYIDHIINPLLSWVKAQIIESFLMNPFYTPHLFQSLKLSQKTDAVLGVSFLTQVHSRDLNFIIENLPSGSYEDLITQNFLKPLQQWAVVRDIYDEKLEESCWNEPLNLSRFLIQEDYYHTQNPSASLEERQKLFQKLHDALKTTDALTFSFHPSIDYRIFYRFQIKLR